MPEAEAEAEAASKSKSPGDTTCAVAADAKTEAENKSESIEQSPPVFAVASNRPRSSPFGRFLIFQISVAAVVGGVLGAFLASYLLEAEYQSVVSKLQTDHQSSLLHTQNEYITCQSNLSDEKRSCEEALFKLIVRADQNEREFQQRVEQHLNETIAAYDAANNGLEVAFSRLRTEADEHESARLQLSQANMRLQAIRNTLTESKRALEAAVGQRDEAEGRALELRRELDLAEEELDRRDVERAECDVNHRNMLTCRESLQGALVDLADARARASDGDDSGELAERLARSIEEKEELLMQVQSLKEKEDMSEALLADVTARAQVFENERAAWENTAGDMMRAVRHRNRKEVVEQFGEGPHRVELIVTFAENSQTESIFLELAPLDFMPHTIFTFLTMIHKNVFSGGTFILSRDHILVAGPLDGHDPQNNQNLEDRMQHEGYFPGGALLFKEYHPEYPHVRYTLGFNQMGGPIFYFNLQDNTESHGPSGEGKKEGDPCFARVVNGWDVIQRIAGMPKGGDDSLEDAVYIAESRVANGTA